MRIKKLAVMHYLNAKQYAALLWEGSPNFDIGKETVEELLETCRVVNKPVPPAFYRGIRSVISDELRHYGEASIEKGPQRKWNDDQQEAWYVALVESVYGMEEK